MSGGGARMRRSPIWPRSPASAPMAACSITSMALDAAGRLDEALVSYDLGANAEMFMPPAVVRHADALLRANQREAASAMLARLNDGRGAASLDALAARIKAGQSSGAPRLTPARGAAIGLYGFAIILLQQEHNADGGLIALSLAQMLDPELDAARILFAEAHGLAGRDDIARRALARIRPLRPMRSARTLDARLL